MVAECRKLHNSSGKIKFIALFFLRVSLIPAPSVIESLCPSVAVRLVTLVELSHYKIVRVRQGRETRGCANPCSLGD